MLFAGHQTFITIGLTLMSLLWGSTAGNQSAPTYCGNQPISFPAVKTTSIGWPPPTGALTGDFNNDGVPDILTTTFVPQFTVFAGNGKGGFVIAGSVKATGSTFGAVTGDFNGDGNLDLAFTSMEYQDALGAYHQGVGVALGRGDGSFATPKVIPTGPDATYLTSGDFDGDGKADLAVAVGSDVLMILFGNGDGTFREPLPVKVPGQKRIQVLAAGDLNKDGKCEIIANSYQETHFSVMTFTGGRFVTYSEFDSYWPVMIVVEDVDGDGNKDLIWNNYNGIFLAKGDGVQGLAKPIVFSAAERYSQFVVHDLNGDGIPDLALNKIDSTHETVAVMLGDGRGGFLPEVDYGVGVDGSAILCADFDGDGDFDLVTANKTSIDLRFVANDGYGGYLAPRVLSDTVGGRDFFFTDLNRDGILDIVASGNSDSPLLIFGKGQFNFGRRQVFGGRFGVGTFSWASAAGDFDGDGRVDIATSSQYTYRRDVITMLPFVDVYAMDLSDSQLGNLSLWSRFSDGGDYAYDVKSADFDHDGKLDLITANALGNTVTVLSGDGKGYFAIRNILNVGSNPRKLLISDLNNDGWIDAVVSNQDSANINILWNTNQGGFNNQTLATPSPCRQAFSADINGDGRLDLVLLSATLPKIYIAFGNGNSGFGNFIEVDVGSLPNSAAVADFTGDGKPDIALTRFKSGSTSDDLVMILAGDGKGGFSPVQALPVLYANQLQAADIDGDGLMDLAVMAGGYWFFPGRCKQEIPSGQFVSLNAASYANDAVPAESVVAGFGADLATTETSASTLPLPVVLGNTRVKITDSRGVVRDAPLFYVSANQVNYQIPAGTAVGVAKVAIMKSGGIVARGTVLVTYSGPGLFSANADGSGVAAASIFRVNLATGNSRWEAMYRYDSAANRFVASPIDMGPALLPPVDDVYLVLYGTGLRSANGAVTVSVGGASVPALYSGPHCCFVGVDQVNVKLPWNLAGAGDVSVSLSVDGITSNTVGISVKK